MRGQQGDGQQGDDEPHPEVWSYEGPMTDGSPRFKVGDRVEVSDVGGPYVVVEAGTDDVNGDRATIANGVVRWDGDYLYACTIPSDDPSAPALRRWVLKQRAAGVERAHSMDDLPVSFFPQAHLRFCRRSS